LFVNSETEIKADGVYDIAAFLKKRFFTRMAVSIQSLEESNTRQQQQQQQY
jgi:hypothetical protein